MTFFVLAIYWAVDVATIMSQTAWSDSYIRGIIDALIIGITLLVVGIPEGLPLAVIISLAYSMKAMTRDNNLVRHLQACETMGGATNICSDKTGTLTMNQMTVMAGWVGGQEFEKVPWSDTVHLSPEFYQILRSGIALNSTAHRQLDKEKGTPKVVGMPTEMALMDLIDINEGCKDVTGYYDALRKEQAATRVLQLPYNSENKYMTTVHFVPDRQVLRVFVKGAPEVIIREAAEIMDADGTIRPCTDDDRANLNRLVAKYAGKAYRTLVVGFRDVPAGIYLRDPNAPVAAAQANEGRYFVDLKTEQIDRRIVVQGLFGIEDPVRPEVPLAGGKKRGEKCVKS